MAAVRKSSPDSVNKDFVKTLEYTNKFLIPNCKSDSRAAIIAKCALIIFTLGLAFIVTLTMDLSKTLYIKLFHKDKPPLRADNPILPTSTDTTPLAVPSSAPAVPRDAPINTTSQNIWNFVNAVFNKENATKTFKSAYDGIKTLPEQSYRYLSNSNNNRYNNIGYALGNTVPFWVAGGILKGSAISLLLNGGGLAIAKIHKKLMTPPENR
ncbi:MAG: hypothetical protein K1060chlam4_01327 [Candidatus Anoxychlamydiales bacterium]|nr:hypothetical protein [Candidatus Anoxychlamydiales bacterium]